MPTNVIMPQLGESVAEGTVIEWLKREGDRVAKDEALLAISTEKVDAEIPSPAAGIVSKILVKAGETAPVGATLAVILAEDEAAMTAPAGTQRLPAITVPLGAPPVVAARPAPTPTVPGPAAPMPGAVGVAPTVEEPRWYSPAVIRLAKEAGVDLSQVKGTGEGGRVTKRDVEAFVAARAAGPAPAPGTPWVAPTVAPTPAMAGPPQADEELVPFTKIRRAIAEHMVRSKQTAPHVTSVSEVDLTRIERFRQRHKDAFRQREGVNLTALPFIIKAVPEVLKRLPMLNATWTEQGILIRRYYHIGVAVALDDGLVVAVLRDADQKSWRQIAVQGTAMVNRARQGRLLPEEVAGSTFTLNNFGAHGNLIGTPILNQPEVGMLGVGTIIKRPVVIDDAVAIRSMAYLCLSYDHRVVDGAVAGRFLSDLRALLEGFDPIATLWADPAYPA